MFSFKPLVLGVLLPALVSGVVSVLALTVAARRDVRRAIAGSWGAALAMGAGYVVGHAALFGWPPHPPREPVQWLVYLALAAIILGVLEALVRAPLPVRWGMRLALAGTTVWLILRPIVVGHWTPAETAMTVGGITLALLAVWFAVDAQAARVTNWSLPAGLLAVLALASLALAFSGSAKLGQLGGVLTAAFGACIMSGWLLAPPSFWRGATALLFNVYGGLLIAHYFYTDEVPLTSIILLAVAPAAGWIVELPPLRRLAAWQSAWLRVVAAVAPSAVALAIVLRSADLSAYG
jgi:hypothetical protein